MANALILKNIQNNELFDPNAFYRLDFVCGLDTYYLDNSKTGFQSLSITFKKYTKHFQSLDAIKSIHHLDRFKIKVNDVDVVEPEAINVPEDITNLYILKPGTVWKNGQLIWESSDSVDIDIVQNATKINNLELINYSDEADKDGKKILPSFKNSHNTYYLKSSDSYFNGQKVTAYIPVMEIIRFYYSGSPYFISQIFNGGFQDGNPTNQLVYKYNYDKQSKLVYMWLKRHCFDSDAILIGRAIADKKAMKEINLIYSTLLRDFTNAYNSNKTNRFRYLCPQTALPFSGNSTLTGQVQWLQPDGNGNFSRLLIRRITSCSSKLPFEKLQIESVDSYDQIDTAQDTVQTIINNEIQQPEDQLKLTHNQQPTSTIERQEYKHYEILYDNFNDVDIEKVKKISEKEVENYRKFKNELIESDHGSTLAANYEFGNKLVPWQITAERDNLIPVSDRIQEISEAIYEICKSESYIELALPHRETDESEPYGLYTFLRPSTKSNKYEWHLVGNGSRKALFLELKNDNKYIYILEIEPTEKKTYSIFFLFHADHAKSNIDHISFLQQIASTSGNDIGKIAQKYHFKKCNLKHTNTVNDSLIDRITRLLGQIFSENLQK